MPKYRLTRRFYDNETLHPVGAILTFEEGKQPRTAVPVATKLVQAEVLDEADDLLLEPQIDLTAVKAGDTLSGLTKKGK